MNTIAQNLHNPQDDLFYVSFKFGDARYTGFLEQYFQLRKQVFVDDLEWDLRLHNGLEIDQYDREGAEYVLAIRDNKCVGGCRMASTDTEFQVDGNSYSYMLRDAKLGRLDGFPTSATYYIPVSSKVWELTRVISGKRPAELRNLLRQARLRLLTKGVKECLFITRPVVTKVSRAWGFDMSVTGPVLDFGKMKALAVKCDILNVGRA